MADQTLQITYGDGSTQTVDVQVSVTAKPPTQPGFGPHTVLIGNTRKMRATLVLTPGPVVAPAPPPEVPTVTITNTPSGASGEIDWVTTGSINDVEVVLDGTSHQAKGNSFQYSGLAAGTHGVMVVVTDVDGKIASTPAVTWTVNPAPSGSPQVLLVMMETYGLSDLQGNSQAPFINSLLGTYGWAPTTALGHNSAVDYVCVSAGVNVHDGPDTDTTIQGDGIDTRFDSRQTIFDQCSAAGLPSVIYTESGSVDYRNPASFFPHIKSLPHVTVNRDFPSNLVADYASKSPPAFAMLIPNNTDNMHSSSIQTGDNFLKGLVTGLGPAITNGLQVVILWDEQDSAGGDSTSAPNGGTVACIVVSNHAKGLGEISSSSTTAGVLGAIEDTFGFSRLGTAAGAPGLGSLLGGGVIPPPPPPPPGTGPSNPVAVGALLFDGLIDTAGTDIGPAWSRGWFGGESFNSFPLSAANITVANGAVTLGTGPGGSPGCFMTTMPGYSADGKGFEFGEGYAEAMLWVPGSGNRITGWPTFWCNKDGGAEIDVVEGGSSSSNGASSNYHDPAHNNVQNHSIGASVCGRWVAYGVDCHQGRNDIWWDGVKVVSYTPTDSLDQKYLLLSNGTPGGGAPMLAKRVAVWAH